MWLSSEELDSSTRSCGAAPWDCFLSPPALDCLFGPPEDFGRVVVTAEQNFLLLSVDGGRGALGGVA